MELSPLLPFCVHHKTAHVIRRKARPAFVSNILCWRAHANKGEEEKGRQTQ